MDFRFVPPDLHRLDETPADILACGIFADQRPPTGLAGLLDWRMAGRVSAQLRDAFADGRAGEALLVTARPRLAADKLLLVGLGARADFGDAAFRAALERVVTVASGLKARRVVAELPGRGDGAMSVSRAAELVVQMTPDPFAWDGWTFVDDAEAARAFVESAGEAARRGRRS